MDIVTEIQEKTSVAQRYQNALGFSIPPIIPFKQVAHVPSTEEATLSRSSMVGNAYVTPVRLRRATEPERGGFLIPTDPIVVVSGKNIITRRNVSKAGQVGSVKELWSRDDFEVTISGVIQDDDQQSAADYQRELLRYCATRESVDIACPLLNNVFDIYRIAIESYDFPFTKGIGYQSFTIKAYSDEVYNLLIEMNPNV